MWSDPVPCLSPHFIGYSSYIYLTSLGFGGCIDMLCFVELLNIILDVANSKLILICEQVPLFRKILRVGDT